jgi:predicted nuclease of predicted toxin-antitoxin system
MKQTGILLDEMYSGLKHFLRILGWDAQSVEDVGLKGAEDTAIVDYASENRLVIVTQDQLMADLARLKKVPCVLIGFVDIAKMIDERLRSMGEQKVF